MATKEYKTGSNLEKVFSRGEFAVTAELGPPKSADFDVIKRKAELLSGWVDAVNITDNQTAIVRVSSIATGKLVLDMGLEPIIQMTCRDRNRLAVQADILGHSGRLFWVVTRDIDSTPVNRDKSMISTTSRYGNRASACRIISVRWRRTICFFSSAAKRSRDTDCFPI